MDFNSTAAQILSRAEVITNARLMELDYYLEGRLQLLKEETDISLRQLETKTPLINRLRAERARYRSAQPACEITINTNPTLSLI